MPHKKRRPYSIFTPPSLCSSELICTTLDQDATDTLIDKWLEHRSPGDDAYQDWFRDLRLHKDVTQNPAHKQIFAWNKGDFVPENIFCRTVDTGRLIPLDRTWTTHVYHHKSMAERKLSMMPVVFTMLPELMLLRGMHDTGCDDIYILVTDLKRQEMDDATAYFKLSAQYAASRKRSDDVEKRMQYEYMCLKHNIAKQHRLPCFPQIDLTLRAILYEKHPRFVILFSHQTLSYSQIFFTHRDYVPDPDIFFDYPTGCPNPSCTEDCEMVKFPRKGPDHTTILPLVDHKNKRRKFKRKEMCNWIGCNLRFVELVEEDDKGAEGNTQGRDGTEESVSAEKDGESPSDTSDSSSDCGTIEDNTTESEAPSGPSLAKGQVCGKCRLVRYCSQEHQFNDWPEHKRVCMKLTAGG